MEELLVGLVPGLPSQLRKKILERAEGVPLYAVETVRMLLDRGLLVQEGSTYQLVGEVDTLEVPETLHALIAARLDGLAPDERRLLGDAAVLGKTFTPQALGRPERPRARSAGRTAHRHGAAGGTRAAVGPAFTRAGPVHVPAGPAASRRLRDPAEARTPGEAPAAAEHLSATLGEEEVSEVVASHLLDAYRLDPEADDGEGLRRQAHEALLRAGARASSLGASTEARRYFEQAADLGAEPRDRAAALSRAGEMALDSGRHRRRLPALRAGDRPVRVRRRHPCGRPCLQLARDRPESPRPARAGDRAAGAGLRGRSARTSRTQTSPSCSPASAGRISSSGISSARAS